MKKKITTALLFILLAYIAPLAFSPELICTPQVFILTATAILIFVTQPPLVISEARSQMTNDKFSVLAIVFSTLFCQIVSVTEWAYFRESFHPFAFDFNLVLGLLLLGGGTVFRIMSIRTLGKYFTATVQTQTDQRIITTGAYSIIRHPSYLGAYLAVLGSAVLLHAYVGIIITLVVMFAAYWYRINAEEETLVREFGNDYRDYQKRTKKLFPFLY